MPRRRGPVGSAMMTWVLDTTPRAKLDGHFVTDLLRRWRRVKDISHKYRTAAAIGYAHDP